MVKIYDNPTLQNVVELRNITQVYQNKEGGESKVIENLNLLIEYKSDEKARFVVILGQSGCGKSSALRYIAGLQEPTRGEVLIFDESRKDPINMVFQQYSSFPWYTVLENVALPLIFKHVPKQDAKTLAFEIIEKVGLKGHENKKAQYPNLSGGQLQRVAIARCLINNPKILLMDEPFGALDLYTRFQMQLFLNKIKESLNTTIIFVTHDISEAVFLADDVYIMKANPGQIVQKFSVNLPQHRDLLVRRHSTFTQQVHEIEDYFLNNLE